MCGGSDVEDGNSSLVNGFVFKQMQLGNSFLGWEAVNHLSLGNALTRSSCRVT